MSDHRRKSLPTKATPTKKLLKIRQEDSLPLAPGTPSRRVLASDLEQKLPSKSRQELFPRPEHSSEEVFDVTQLWGSFQQVEHSSEKVLGTTQLGGLDLQEPQEEPPSHDDHCAIPVARRVLDDASSCRGCFQPQACASQAPSLLRDLARDVTPTRLRSCFSRLLCCQKPEEETQVSLFPSAESPVTPIRPKAKPPPPPPPRSAKARAPPPPPPKAKAKAFSVALPSSATWKGQKPAPQWKTDKVVNCSPIRQPGLLEGSIWQQVNQTIEQRGDEAPLCEETLNSAFMRLADGSKTPRGRKSIATARRRKKVEKQRIFPQSLQLKADLLHSQLVRQGFADLERLQEIIGLKPQSAVETAGSLERNHSEYSTSSSDTDDSEESDDSDSTASDDTDSSKSESEYSCASCAELDEDALEVLLNFLHLADGREDLLTQPSGTGMERKRLSVSSSPGKGGKTQLPLAAAEQLLQQLLTQVGSAKLMQTRVSLMLSMNRFPKEADHLEDIMKIGINAARSVVKSTALPQLLQGYLVLVNYVNHDSQQLGSARGVTLDSLAKLAHTKCRPPSQKEGMQQKERTPQKTTDALHLLVRQVQEKQEPTWLATLTADLETCREACEVDYTAISSGIADLAEKVTTIESHIRSMRGSRADTEPPALTPARLTPFVASALLRLAALRRLHEELESATTDMRKYFAEPPTSPLPAMLRSLASLFDALPRPEATSAARNLVDKFDNAHSVQANFLLSRVRGQSCGG